ncbi:MAG: DUF3368 domain-containing protein [Luteolibacter sp.]|uniref:DUF3368 domain-containing protein n=1 Tax=Luteolibacter sp. TaxID=1962973 RepID=UPI00326728B7
MSTVVCNAGPLIALAGIGQLGILRDLFDVVFVAREVRNEVEAGGSKGAGANLLSNAPWIQQSDFQIRIDPLLESLLDKGEAATIALAIHSSASLILMDELKGRRIARGIHGLAVIGTGRLLVEAKRANLIGEVRPLIDRMRSNGYWLSDRIVAEIARLAGE